MMVKEPIAIVGSGCRFSGGATTPSKLWSLLKDPPDLTKEIPTERFNANRYYHPDNSHHGTTNVRHAYFLQDDIRLFDADFFHIKPVEAAAMDPQQRLLMETVYESLESAGISLEALRGSQTGVFVGNMSVDYADILLQDPDSFPTYLGPGTARSILSNRISYFLDLHGPSMTVDTACSASLTALHLAVQSLRSGEAVLALVAGANLLLSPDLFRVEARLKMLSSQGRCRMWDEVADGYARGEGVACVVLKTLSDALRDGDSVECIIRETGASQDGRTSGLTMPNPAAQAMLIQDTYRRAGLDLSRPSDRPQYFEAHGTGTPAGDPVEAEAISTAFYGPKSGFFSVQQSATSQNLQDTTCTSLLVGSVKTVIGHTEGTAGLASIMKTSLALQNGQVPPNLHLNRLSPAVKPHCRFLDIPTTLQDWPLLPDGAVRRASVNSFGFGGANVHAILESYTPDAIAAADVAPSPKLCRPFTFTPILLSAKSKRALEARVAAYAEYLERGGVPEIDLPNLSYTLHHRRSTLQKRAFFWSSSAKGLASELRAYQAAAARGETESLKGTKPSSTSRTTKANITGPRGLRSLGIFTGQGAQWPRMGSELIERSPSVAKMVERLEMSLATIPTAADRPSWSLRQELLATPDESRVYEAEISQPLCTAVQLVLVDLLREAGVKLDAVVGHSSGEIAAAYAGGFISAGDAIRIAYYRGFHLRRSHGAAGQQPGAMMAVGASLDDAQELCGLAEFGGRVSVAASNSPSSVTLSGDADAIKEAGLVYEDEGKFHRALRVDKAYHSHHMQPCVGPYTESLRSCHILASPADAQDSCTWISSVHVKDVADLDSNADLASVYWAQNMAQPVLFCQAVEMVLREMEPFDRVIEVGAHPALKGPVEQIFQDQPPQDRPPYFSTLERNQNAIASLAKTLGSLWETDGQAAGLDLSRYEAILSGFGHDASAPQLQVIKGLPPYPWDHQTTYYHDSRFLRALRMASKGMNELLGMMIPDNLPGEARWRNSLRANEISWLTDHRLQDQAVFPAAAYVASAVEAVKEFWLGGSLGSPTVVEIRDFSVGQALVVPEQHSGGVGVETLVSLTNIKPVSDKAYRADFTFYSHDGRGFDTNDTRSAVTSMDENASAIVFVYFGDADPGALPSRPESRHASCMVGVDEEHFYHALNNLGYGYRGDFRCLTALKRKMDFATGRIRLPGPAQDAHQGLGTSRLLVPPALDAALQSIILAYSFPGDTRLRSIHVPTGIDVIRINLPICQQVATDDISFQSSVSSGDFDVSIAGDTDLYMDDGTALVQIQGLHTRPLVPATQQADLHLFSEYAWGPWEPEAPQPVPCGQEAALEKTRHETLERVAYYYLRALTQAIPAEARAGLGLSAHHMCLLRYADDTLRRIEQGQVQHVQRGWKEDTHQDIMRLAAGCPDSADLQLMQAVGENLAAAILSGGSRNILESMVEDNKLNRYYVEASAMPRYLDQLGTLAAQIGHRYPRMNVLEVGAGTGGATKTLLRHLDGRFDSYTFTDVSSAFFSHAQDEFSSHPSFAKMGFRTLDLEKDIETQGYAPGSFDLVIASLVLHATSSLESTMRNLRRLTRPGAYLLVLEITDNDQLRLGITFGGLPGWWLGQKDGRELSPCVDVGTWDGIMRSAGFSGAEEVVHHSPTAPLSVIMTRATDEQLTALLATSSISSRDMPLDHGLTVLVPQGPGSTDLAAAAQDVFARVSPYYARPDLLVVTEIDELPSHTQHLPGAGTVLSLLDLGSQAGAIFQGLTGDRLLGLQHIFQRSRCVLWVTTGAKSGQDPYAAMMIGLSRTVALEMSHLRLQIVDYDSRHSVVGDPGALAEALLRLEAEAVMEQRRSAGGSMSDFLWSAEPELYRDKGRWLIPRLVLAKERNQRRNAAHRNVVGQVNPVTTPVTLTATLAAESWPYALVPESSLGRRLVSCSRPDSIRIRVMRSMLASVKLASSDYLYLVVGTVEGNDNGLVVVALSDAQSSVVEVDRTWSIPVPRRDLETDAGSCYYQSRCERGEAIMMALHDHLLAESLLNGLQDGSVLTLLDAPPLLAQAVDSCAARRTMAVVSLRTSTTGTSCPKPENALPRPPVRPNKSVLIHPHEPMRSIASRTPLSRTDRFCVFSGAPAASAVMTAILPALPPRCEVMRSWCDLSRAEPFISRRTMLGLDCQVASSLRMAWLNMQADQTALDARLNHWERPSRNPSTDDGILRADPISIVKHGESMFPGRTAGQMLVVDWTAHTDHGQGQATVPARIQPLSRTIGFSGSKTYWLVGLTGGLGQSLCRWLVDRGARHIVMSSRNPNAHVDRDWIRGIQESVAPGQAGEPVVDIRLLENDISDRGQVQSTYAAISAAMPPLGGVVQGAMVLDDRLFAETTMESVNKILGPKVSGSLNLDEVLGDTPLEFLVYLSSIACVSGNQGQSVYAAANCFMSALATSRRNRGLAASAVHVGAVVGNGYVTRETSMKQRRRIWDNGNLWMSEQDFLTAFAEGVLASRRPADGAAHIDHHNNDNALGAAPSRCTWEVVAGLRTLDASSRPDVGGFTWASNPKFQHLVVGSGSSNSPGGSLASGRDGGDGQGSGKMQLIRQLRAASTPETARELLRGALAARLRSLLQVSSDRDDEDILETSLDELGMDSLMAVEVRSWLSGEVGADVTILEILNAGNAACLVEVTAGRMASHLGPDPQAVLGKGRDGVGDTTGAGLDGADKPMPPAARPGPDQDAEEELDTTNKADGDGREAKRSPESVAVIGSILPRPGSADVASGTTDESLGGASRRGSLGSSESCRQHTDSQVDVEEPGNNTPSSSLSLASLAPFVPGGAGATIPPEMMARNPVPLSSSQSRFWFLRHFVPDQTAFNVSMVIRLRGTLDGDRLGRAVAAVVDRHEALRTAFAGGGTGFCAEQMILKKGGASPNHLETELVEPLGGAELERRTQQAVEAVRAHVYELERGDTLKMKLITTGGAGRLHSIVIGFHHIVMDGVSMEIFVKDLQTAYDGGVFPTGVLQYPDFSIREAQQARHGRWKTELAYWKHEFARVPEPLPLLPLSERSARPGGVVPYGTVRVDRWLSPELSSLVRTVAQRLRSGVFAVYLAVLQAVIVRFVAVDEFCVGVADANRRDGDVLESIGLYLGLLPLRVVNGNSPSRRFADAVRDMHLRSRAAFAHAGVPFDALLRELGVARSASHAPLFQVFMSYRPGVNEVRELCGCDGEADFLGGGELAYDISLDVVENPNQNPNPNPNPNPDANPDASTGMGTHVMLSVQASLYGQEAARVLLDVFCNLLEAFALNPSARLSSPALYAQPQLDQALVLGRGPAHDHAWPPTLAHRIHDVVRSHPHRPCLLGDVDGGDGGDGGSSLQLTYSQMGRAADRIVDEMAELLGDVPGRGAVAVLQDPTPASICSIYAILKSGRAYVPLDPLVGAARLRAIAAESQPSCILVDDSTESLVPGIVGVGVLVPVIINVTRLMHQSMAMAPACGTGSSSEPRPVAAQPTDLAAVLYTSGSTTGKPKGICLSHLALRNNMEISSRQFLVPDRAGAGRGDDDDDEDEDGVAVVVMQQTAPSFDMSLCQVLCALCNGGSLVVAPAHVRRDPALLARLMRGAGVTHTLATPAEYASLVRHGASDLAACGSWRAAVSGGDRLTLRVVDGFRSLANRGLRLVDAYGPAEVTFACASAEVPYHDVVDGRPSPAPLETFPNYAVCIMGEDMKPVPLGVPGEVCVSGAGVGPLGYLHDPVLTADRFLPHGSPLAPDATTSTFASQGWTTLHRTGDRGKLIKVDDGAQVASGGVVGARSSSSSSSSSSFRAGLVLLGRMQGDSQLKVRGIRIDAQEVEDALTQCEDAWSGICVAQAGVSARTDDRSGTDFLVAHVVLHVPEHLRNGDGNVEGARAAATARLLRELPGLPSTLAAYMRPSALVPVPGLPLTPSKKLDRQALRSLPVYCRRDDEGDNGTSLAHAHSAPVPAAAGDEGPGEVLAPVHEAIRQLWERVIPASLVRTSVDDVVGPRTDFFHVGGTSLLLVELHALLKEMLGPSSPELPSVQQLFQSSTLEGMARLLRGTRLARIAPTIGHDAHIGPSDQDMDQDDPARALSSSLRTTPSTDQQQRTATDWEKEAGLLSHARYGKARYHQQEQEQEQAPAPREEEDQIEDNSERSSAQAGPPAGEEVRVRVVLTGATGFLGSHILEMLLEDPAVDRVYAVAVRLQERPGGPPRELPPAFHDRRVEVYFGDLGAPDLGLSQPLVERIFSAADAVIHNGADVSFLKSYGSLRPANVDATKQLALWAVRYGRLGGGGGRRRGSSPQGIPFHFVSSASVAQLAQGGGGGAGMMAGHDAMREACEASLAGHPPTASTDGYVAAKWVAERHLEQVAAAYGLPVTIHRPPSIVRRGGEDDHDDRGSNNQNNDLVANMFKFAQRLQALPDFGHHVLPGGVLHVVSAEAVAGTIVRHAVGSYHDEIESCSSSEEGGAGIRGPASISSSTRVRYLYEGCREGAIALPATITGQDDDDAAGLGLVPWAEWVERAEAEGMNPLLAEYLRKTFALGGGREEAHDCARPSAFSQEPQPALARS